MGRNSKLKLEFKGSIAKRTRRQFNMPPKTSSKPVDSKVLDVIGENDVIEMCWTCDLPIIDEFFQQFVFRANRIAVERGQCFSNASDGSFRATNFSERYCQRLKKRVLLKIREDVLMKMQVS